MLFAALILLFKFRQLNFGTHYKCQAPFLTEVAYSAIQKFTHPATVKNKRDHKIAKQVFFFQYNF